MRVFVTLMVSFLLVSLLFQAEGIGAEVRKSKQVSWYNEFSFQQRDIANVGTQNVGFALAHFANNRMGFGASISVGFGSDTTSAGTYSIGGATELAGVLYANLFTHDRSGWIPRLDLSCSIGYAWLTYDKRTTSDPPGIYGLQLRDRFLFANPVVSIYWRDYWSRESNGSSNPNIIDRIMEHHCGWDLGIGYGYRFIADLKSADFVKSDIESPNMVVYFRVIFD